MQLRLSIQLVNLLLLLAITVGFVLVICLKTAHQPRKDEAVSKHWV